MIRHHSHTFLRCMAGTTSSSRLHLHRLPRRMAGRRLRQQCPGNSQHRKASSLACQILTDMYQRRTRSISHPKLHGRHPGTAQARKRCTGLHPDLSGISQLRKSCSSHCWKRQRYLHTFQHCTECTPTMSPCPCLSGTCLTHTIGTYPQMSHPSPSDTSQPRTASRSTRQPQTETPPLHMSCSQTTVPSPTLSGTSLPSKGCSC